MSWRLGVATGSCMERPILETLDAIEAAGFRFVEIGTPPRHFDPWSDSQIATVKERLTRGRLTAVSIHSPFGGILDLSELNPQHQNAAIGGIAQSATALRELGGSIVVVHPSDVSRNAHDGEERLAASSRGLARTALTLEQMGMRLAVESPLPHLVGGSPGEFERLVADIDHGAGICLDTGHVTLGKSWDRFMEISRRRLLHVHASDHGGSFDDHLPPGDGILDWAHIAESLRGAAYEGYVILELSCPDGPLVDFLTRARVKAEALLGDGKAESD